MWWCTSQHDIFHIGEVCLCWECNRNTAAIIFLWGGQYCLLLISRKFIFTIGSSHLIEQVSAIHWLGYKTIGGLIMFPSLSQEYPSYGLCLHTYVYCLYSDAVSSQNIKHWLVGWFVNNYWKWCGRKQLWSNFKCYPDIYLEGLRKTTNNLNQDSQCPVETHTNHPLNASLKRYGFNQIALCFHLLLEVSTIIFMVYIVMPVTQTLKCQIVGWLVNNFVKYVEGNSRGPTEILC